MKKKHYHLDELKKVVRMVDKIETQSMHLFVLEADRRRFQEEVSQLEYDITKLKNDKSIAKRELDSMEGARELLIIMVQSLMQEKVYLEKQVIQLYSGNQLVPFRSV